MFRGDDKPLGGGGLNELPPYYSRRLQVALPTTHTSVRTERSQVDADAQAERLFRDFKMGLLTLVVVALLLLAYFWDGGGNSSGRDLHERDDVLSFSVTTQRRADLVPRIVRDQAPPPQTAAVPPAETGAPQGAPPRQEAPPAPRTYTVRPGDTLSGIALRHYGDATLWTLILEANRARLRRPADLRPGMKLVVPARPEASASRAEPPPYLARAGPPGQR